MNIIWKSSVKSAKYMLYKTTIEMWACVLFLCWKKWNDWYTVERNDYPFQSVLKSSFAETFNIWYFWKLLPKKPVNK